MVISVNDGHIKGYSVKVVKEMLGLEITQWNWKYDEQMILR
jgi:hypothetical protein